MLMKRINKESLTGLRELNSFRSESAANMKGDLIFISLALFFLIYKFGISSGIANIPFSEGLSQRGRRNHDSDHPINGGIIHLY